MTTGLISCIQLQRLVAQYFSALLTDLIRAGYGTTYTVCLFNKKDSKELCAGSRIFEHYIANWKDNISILLRAPCHDLPVMD